MRPISDQLFSYLTYNIVKCGRSIEDFVNSEDGKIYLVKTRDKDFYFVVRGKFVLTAKDEIDYSKSDSCVFGLNCQTDKFEALDIYRLKVCVEEADLAEYLKELKEIYFDYLEQQHTQRREVLLAGFRELVDHSRQVLASRSLVKGEDYISYAKRLCEQADEYNRAIDVLVAKEIVDNLWIQVLYEPKKYDKLMKIICGVIGQVM